MSLQRSSPAHSLLVLLLMVLAGVDVLGCNNECVCARPKRCRSPDWDAALDEGSAKDISTDVVVSLSGLTHVPAPCQHDHRQALKHIRTINLTGSPLTCDCHMTWLLEWYHATEGQQLQGSCSLPASLHNKKLTDLTEAELECDEVFLTVRPDPLSPSGVQLACGTRGGGEIPADNAWILKDGTPLPTEPGTLAVTLPNEPSSAATQWQCKAALPTLVSSPTVTTSTLAGCSQCVVWGQQHNSASGCVSSGVGGAGGGATSAIFSSLSVGPVHNWSCKGTKGRNRCLSSGEMLITAQRDLKSEGSLCPSLRVDQVFVVGSGRGLLGFGDGRSYRHIFRSLWKASIYRLHLHLAPASDTSAVVPVLVKTNKELVAEVHISQNQSSVSVITHTSKQGTVIVVELELVHLVNVSDFTYEPPRVVVMEMYLEELTLPVLSAEEDCERGQGEQVHCQKEFTLAPTRLTRDSRTTSNGTIAFQVNGFYVPYSAESAMVTMATGEGSQFNFTIKVQHKLLRDSEGEAPLQQVILSFSTVDNLTSPLLPEDLQTLLQPDNSLLGMLVDIRAVFIQSRLFSDSMAKDLNMWRVEVYYRLLDKDGSFVWHPLPSPHTTAAANPGDNLQQLLDQLPAHAKLTLAPGIYHQSLVINKPVTILSSEGANRTIIYGHVTVKSDNITLVGLAIHPVNGSAAVTTSHANTALYNSIVSDSEGGKIPSDTTRNTSGIACMGCIGLSIRYTLINGMTEGVSLTNSKDVVIVNSVISSCIKGLVIRQSSNGLVCQNLFQNNQLANEKDKNSSVSFQDNRFNRNLESFNGVVHQSGSTVTGPSSIMDDRRGILTPPPRLPVPKHPSPFGAQSQNSPPPISPNHGVLTPPPRLRLTTNPSPFGTQSQTSPPPTNPMPTSPPSTSPSRGVFTPPPRLPVPTNPSPFGTQSQTSPPPTSPMPTSPMPTSSPPTRPMPTTSPPTSPPHSVYTHVANKPEIASLRVSINCTGVTAQNKEWSALMSKLTSKAVDGSTYAGVLGSVLLLDSSAAPQTSGILATNAPGPLQRSRSKHVLARVWVEEKPKWLSDASLSLIWKGTVVASQPSDQTLSVKLTKGGTYIALLHDGLDVMDTATLEVEVASCRSSGVLKPVSVQVGKGFKLKCPLCSAKGSPVRYMWYRNGQVVPGADKKVLRVTSAAMQHAGGYHCRVVGQTAGSTIVDVTVQGTGYFGGSVLRHVFEGVPVATPLGIPLQAVFPLSNGTVVYSLKDSSNGLFAINSSSGQLLTACPCLDREMKDSYILRVEAAVTMVGQPDEVITRSLEVKVEDVYDEAPVFNRAGYHTTVWKGTSSNSQILQFQTRDPDLSDYVTLTLEDPRDTFKLLGGTLYTAKPLLEESTYQMNVTAHDKDGLTSTVPVTVVVIDQTNSLGTKVAQLNHTAYVKEGKVPSSPLADLIVLGVNMSFIDHCHILSPQPGSVTLDTDLKLWLQRPLSLDASHIDNRVICQEISGQLLALVEVTVSLAGSDKDQLGASQENEGRQRRQSAGNIEETPFRVVVGDRYVESQFYYEEVPPLVVDLPEEQPAGSLKVFVDMGQGAPKYTEEEGLVGRQEGATGRGVVYALQSGGSPVHLYEPHPHSRILTSPCGGLTRNFSFTLDKFDLPFSVSHIEGQCHSVVTNTRPLDAEQDPPLYNLEVSSFLIAEGLLTAQSVKLQIRVGDINDNRPIFEQSTYNLSLKENFLGPFAGIRATDLDSSEYYSKVAYSLNETPLFAINSSTGVMSSKRPFDYEKDPPCYDLVVRAADQDGQQDTTNVLVCIRDANDNCPTFNHTMYVINVPEDTPASSTLMHLSAIDLDVTEDYQTVAFYFLPEELTSDTNFPFFVDSVFGHLILRTSLDYEGTQTLFQFPVYASDESGNACGTNVTVHVSDVNDEAPFFKPGELFIEVSIPENTFPYRSPFAKDNIVGCITAEDKDSKEIQYFLLKNSSFFELSDAIPGCVLLKKALDFEIEQVHRLLVKATDGTLASQESAVLQVNVENVLDSGPWLPERYDVVITENENPFEAVIVVKVNDAPQDRLRPLYELVEEACSHFFYLDQGGHLYLQAGLDYERREVCPQFTVRVTHRLYQLSTQVFVTVLPTNDNRPLILNRNPEESSFPEDTPPLGWSLEIKVQDLDVYENGTRDNITLIVSSYDGSDLPDDFPLMLVTGDDETLTLTNSRVIDYEKDVHSYNLKIYAFDGKQQSFNPFYLSVHVLDVNDQSPVFPHDQYVFTTDEEVGDVFLNVVAEDPDDTSLQYSIVNVNNTFLPFVINSRGRISNTQFLDAETMSLEYHFLVVAEDAGGLTASAEVSVYVKDVNEFRPRFRRFKSYLDISESTPVGTTLEQVTATDQDVGPVYGRITFSLIPQNNEKLPFEIEPDSGFITLKEMLDYETKEEYDFLVSATDGGGLGISGRMFVIVEDVLDVPPCPCADTTQATYVVEENKFVYLNVWKVEVCGGFSVHETDFILERDYGGRFRVDQFGRVFITRGLDHEETERYVLHIGLSSHSLSCNYPAVLTVDITDVDEFEPEFDRTQYSYALEETRDVGPIFQIHADDRDKPDHIVSYSIVSSQAASLPFTVNRDGTIVLTRSLDADDPVLPRTYSFTVTATTNQGKSTEQPTKIAVNVIDVNDEKPVFTRPSYAFSIVEGTSVGIPVVTVTAVDHDFDPAYSTISYSILTEQSQFQINAVGEISSTTELDFEQRGSEPYHFRVQASDGANVARIPVTITLLDRNEFSPEFPQESYSFEIALNATFGDVVGELIAVDPDGTGHVVSYRLVGNSHKEPPFTISDLGILSVAFNDDSQLMAVFHFAVIAIDQGGLQSAAVPVQINVLGLNDIQIPTEYCLEVMEGTVPSDPLVQLGLETQHLDITKFAYTLLSTGIPFSVASNHGDLYLEQPLDYEAQAHYEVDILARNKYGLEFNVTVIVCVLNGNDHPPQLEQTQVELMLSADADAGQLLTVAILDGDQTLSAPDTEGLDSTLPHSCCTDPHKQLEGKDVLFTVEGGGGDESFEAVFDQNRRLLVLSSLVPASALPNCRYDFVISANDEDGLTSPTPLLVSVHIDKTPQFPPVFQGASSYQLTLLENTAANLTTVTAQLDTQREPCLDASQHTVQYSIQSQTDVPFAVNGNGVLYTTREVDFESDPRTYTFEVVASNSAGLSSSVTVTVTLEDVNEFCPQFPSRTVTVSLPELMKSGTTVTVLQATDDDGSTKHSSVTFKLVDSKDRLVIDVLSTGEVVLSEPVTFVRGEKNVHRFQVQALNNMGMETPDLNCTEVSLLSLKVKVIDENNQPPFFEQVQYRFEVNESVVVSHEHPYELGSLIFSDPDTTGEAMSFEMHPQLPFLNINQDGVLRLTSGLDHEAQSNYSVQVTVTDGTNAGTNTAQVTIIALNANEFPPELQGPMSVTLPENTIPGGGIVDFAAVDRDSGLFGQVQYFISGKYASLFTISNTGTMSNVRSFDYETDPHSYIITVSARDGGGKSASHLLVVNLTDVNDNAPVFDFLDYQVNVTEMATYGKPPILQMRAIDADITPDFRVISYSLQDKGRNRFSLNASSGVLSLSHHLDYETQPHSFTLRVVASDQDGLSSTTTVTVALEDSNDNSPIITDQDGSTPASSFVANITEDSPPNTQVLVLTAIDNDASERYSSVINFSIMAIGEEDIPFSVTPSGHLVLSGVIERQQVHHFGVVAVDSGNKQSQVVTVTVTITAVNKAAPEFDPVEYHATVAENNIPSDPLARLNATDPDGDPIHFNLVSGLANVVTVDNSGRVYLDQPFDFEAGSQFRFDFEISDGKFTSPLHAVLLVSILPVNEFKPVVTTAQSAVTIPESTQEGGFSLILTTSDRDADLPDTRQGEIQEVMLLTGSPYFHLTYHGNGTATLSNARKFDYESGQTYFRLLFQAKDGGNLTSSVPFQVTVEVIDENDNSPAFTEEVYSFAVSENMAGMAGSVKAIDRDAHAEFSSITYQISIEESFYDSCPGSVEINSEGEIFLDQPFDYECAPTVVQLVVTACDPDMKCSELPVKMSLLDENEFPPMFEVAGYSVNINETVSVGTVILEVQATDRDGSSAFGEVVRYEAYSLPEVFNFTSLGELRVAKALDYETQVHEYNFQIAALDGQGKRGLTNVGVSISNVNEHPPEFTILLYEVTVPENGYLMLPDGLTTDVLATLVVEDKDANSSLPQFEVNSTEIAFPFTVTQEGSVVLQRLLDYEKRSFYEFTVLARDGSHVSPQPAVVRVTVTNDNDNAPYFERGLYEYMLEENVLPVGMVMQLKAVDGDGHLTPLLYAVNGGHLPQGVINLTDAGSIVILQPLDYELLQYVEFQVSAFDGRYTSINTTTVIVRVLPINDEPPQFIETTYNAVMNENTPPEKFSLLVSISDRDIWPEGESRTQLSFNLRGSPHFAVIPDSTAMNAIIYNTKEFDFETDAHTYILLLIANDGRFTSKDTATVTVSLADINDHSPQLEAHAFNFTIREDSVLVGKVRATDGDSGVQHSSLTYTLQPTRPGSLPFEVTQNGSIYATSMLNYESGITEYSFVVWVMDRQGLNDSARTVVTVTDVNDNPPHFMQALYQASVAEDMAVDSVVLQLTAVDLDVSAAYAVSSYLLQDDTDLPFYITSDGLLYLARELDYESNRHLYSFEVVAVDGGGLRGTTQVEVMVANVPDVTPCAEYANYSVSLPENSVPSQPIVRIVVPTNDGGGALHFTAVTPQDLASNVYLSSDGLVTVTAPFDFETFRRVEFEVAITNGFLSCPELVLVEITVLDVNEFSPQVQEVMYTIDLEENTAIEPLMVVRATDRDSGKFGRIIGFRVDPVAVPFYVTENGTLYPNRVFDAERDLDRYQFRIYAVDSGEKESSPSDVTVRILDINEHIPQFSELFYEITLPESMPPNSAVFQLVAVDNDRTASALRFTAMGGDVEYFTVDSLTGSVTLNQRIDFEITGFLLRLLVRVEDEGGLNSQAEIHIYIKDVNEYAPGITAGVTDSPPEFPESVPSVVTVPENTPQGTIIEALTLSITDRDRGMIFGNITSVELEGDHGYFALQLERVNGSAVVVARLHVAKAIDRESSPSSFSLVYTACDGGLLCAQQSVLVAVGDINEYPPVFDKPQYFVTIPENTEVKGRPFFVLGVTDNDAGSAGIVTCMALNSSFFAFDNNCGMYVIHSLDYCKQKEHVVQVTAADGETDRAYTSETTVIVTVTHVNTHPVSVKLANTELVMNEQSFLRVFEGISIIDEDCEGSFSANITVKDQDHQMNNEGLQLQQVRGETHEQLFPTREQLNQQLNYTIYYNDDDEPTSRVRIIELNISDGEFYVIKEIRVSILPKNDHIGIFHTGQMIPVYFSPAIHTTSIAMTPHLAFDDFDTGVSSYRAVATLLPSSNGCDQAQENIEILLNKCGVQDATDLLPNPSWEIPLVQHRNAVPYSNKGHLGYYFLNAKSTLVQTYDKSLNVSDFSFVTWVEVNGLGAMVTVTDSNGEDPVFRLSVVGRKVIVNVMGQTLGWKFKPLNIGWFHVAVSVKGTAVVLYINAIAQATKTLPVSNGVIHGPLLVSLGSVVMGTKQENGFIGALSGTALVEHGDVVLDHVLFLVNCSEHVALDQRIMNLQEGYADLRYEPDTVSGLLRIYVNTTAPLFELMLKNFIYLNSRTYPDPGQRYTRIYAWDGHNYLGHYGTKISVLRTRQRSLHIDTPNAPLLMQLEAVAGGVYPLQDVRIVTDVYSNVIESLMVDITRSPCYIAETCTLSVNLSSVDLHGCSLRKYYSSDGKVVLTGLAEAAVYEGVMQAVCLSVSSAVEGEVVEVRLHVSDYNGLYGHFSSVSVQVEGVDRLTRDGGLQKRSAGETGGRQPGSIPHSRVEVADPGALEGSGYTSSLLLGGLILLGCVSVLVLAVLLQRSKTKQ